VSRQISTNRFTNSLGTNVTDTTYSTDSRSFGWYRPTNTNLCMKN